MEYSKQALWLRFLISEVFGSNLELTTSLLGQTTALSREQPFSLHSLGYPQRFYLSHLLHGGHNRGHAY
jgi:hypothetical protein